MERGNSIFHCKEEMPSISIADYLRSTSPPTKGSSSSPTAPTPSSCSRWSTSTACRNPSRDLCWTTTAFTGTGPSMQIAHRHRNGRCQVRWRLLLQEWFLCQDRRHLQTINQYSGIITAQAAQLPPLHHRARTHDLPRSARGLPGRQPNSSMITSSSFCLPRSFQGGETAMLKPERRINGEGVWAWSIINILLKH